MTAAALPQTEAQFQAAVVDYARRNGWKTCHFHDSRRQVRPGVHVGDRDAAGFPDLVCVRERVVYAELKGPKTRVSDAQLEWMQALSDAGEEVYLWRPKDWGDIEKVLGRGRA